METELRRDHIIVAVVDLEVQILLSEVFHCGIELIGLIELSPPFLILLDTLRTEIRRHHVTNPPKSPLENILSSSTPDIKHMENLIELIPLLEIEFLFDLFAHVLAVHVHED